MDEAIGPTQIDKSTEITETADDTPTDVPFLQIIQQALFLCLSPLARCRPLGEDQPIPTAIQLNDLEVELVAHYLAKPLLTLGIIGLRRKAHTVYLRRRHETPHPADIDDQATAVGTHNGLFDNVSRVENFGSLLPVRLNLGA